jgi:two-component system, OmpR family, response regulator
MKVLLIEDDAKIAENLQRGLTAEGFTVERSADGLDGLWRATEGQFDAIVLDILLPGLNGYQVCRRLRDAGNWTPILMLTAKSGELDETEGLDTGADDYLTKPFSFAVLVSRLRALLRRSSNGIPDDVVIGDLHVDWVRRRVSRGGELIELTAREFDVLNVLVRRRGQVLSKTDLLDAVWDTEFCGDPNIVEVYVARLRRKLEHGAVPLIETIRGAGYRLVDDV